METRGIRQSRLGSIKFRICSYVCMSAMGADVDLPTH